MPTALISRASYNLGSAAQDGADFTVQFQTPTAFAWNGVGDKFFTSGYDTTSVEAYSVSEAYSIGGATPTSGFSLPSTAGLTVKNASLAFNADGTKVFASTAPDFFSAATLEEFSLSVPYGGTATRVQGSGGWAGPFSMQFADNGAYFFYVAGTTVYREALGTAFDPFSSTATQTVNLSSDFSSVRSVVIGRNGTRMVASGDSNVLREYRLSSAYSLSTPALTGASVAMAAGITDARSVVYSPDGERLSVLGSLGSGSGTDANGDPIIFGALRQYATVN